MVFLILIAAKHQLERGVDQECAEDKEHPGETGDQSRTNQNEQTTENQRDGDTDRQHIFLDLLGYCEVRHNDDEHKEVVNGQRILGQPAGIELDGRLGTSEKPDESTEYKRHDHEERDMLHAFLGGRHVRATANDEQVDDEEQCKHHKGDDFKCEWGFCHDSLH